MWISKDEYNFMEEQIAEYRKKAKEYEDLLSQVQLYEQLSGPNVVLDGKCILMTLDTFCKRSSNETRLQEEIKKLEAERDFFKYQYAYEKFAKEIDGIDMDWRKFAEALQEFMAKNQSDKEDNDGQESSDGRTSTTDIDTSE